MPSSLLNWHSPSLLNLGEEGGWSMPSEDMGEAKTGQTGTVEEMDVKKNAAIKLFGKRIPLSLQAGGDEKNRDEDEHEQEEQSPKLKNQDQETPDSQERCEVTTSASDKIKRPLIEHESSTSEEQAGGASDPTEKTTARKPDKILPCPRCKSMETKFCYYNNYNVNQPRHFCKSCQRYWTAGGTMRNVPVGAGRRKNKNSCHYLQIAIPKSAVQALQPDKTVLRHHPCSAPGGAVFSFGTSDGFHQAPKKNSPASDGFHQGPVAAAMPRATNTGEETSAPFPCFNRSTWQLYPWNQPLPLRAASIPVPVYPAAYSSWATPPATWCIPLPSPAASSSSSSIFPSCGKHSRDGEDGSKRCNLVPKTLRIDDPEAAAKSSICTMVGIKSSKNTTVGGGGLFKAFQPWGDAKNHAIEGPLLLHANPAALSRSLNFQESS